VFVVGVSAHRYGWVLVVKSEINGGAGRLPSRLRTGQSLWCCCCCLVLLEDRGMLISFACLLEICEVLASPGPFTYGPACVSFLWLSHLLV